MTNHQLYTIEVSFVVCDGLQDKALEEVKELMNHVTKSSLSHTSDLKIKVRHESIEH
jgi:uncharacterized membrane protein